MKKKCNKCKIGAIGSSRKRTRVGGLTPQNQTLLLLLGGGILIGAAYLYFKKKNASKPTVIKVPPEAKVPGTKLRNTTTQVLDYVQQSGQIFNQLKQLIGTIKNAARPGKPDDGFKVSFGGGSSPSGGSGGQKANWQPSTANDTNALTPTGDGNPANDTYVADANNNVYDPNGSLVGTLDSSGSGWVDSSGNRYDFDGNSLDGGTTYAPTSSNDPYTADGSGNVYNEFGDLVGTQNPDGNGFTDTSGQNLTWSGDQYDPSATGYDPTAGGYDASVIDNSNTGYDPNAGGGYDASVIDNSNTGYDPNAGGGDAIPV